MRRRRFIAATAGVAALGGCLGTIGGDGSGGSMDDATTTHDGSMDDEATDDGMDGNGSMEDGDSMDGNESTDEGGMDDDSELHSHPGTAGLADQPHLGPDPSEADAVVVAFEDPSCPNCKRFETGAFQRIRSEWTESGTASFVFRGFPVVYPWGEPASHALEAAYAHDEDAFWALKEYYFAEQSSFGEDDVLSKTETFLGDETGVDAATVVEEARQETHHDAVQSDLSAGQDAGFSGTPSFLLFKDGSLVTELTGPKSFSVFENALQL